MSRANLQRAKLNDADLRNVRLHSAQLESAVLTGADLRFAELNQARAQYTLLQGANLSSASLHNTNLQRARMRGAKLRGTDLRGADLQWADLLMADLSGARIDNAGIRRSAMTPAMLQDFQRRGMLVAEGAFDRAPISTEGLWIRGGLDGGARAGLGLLLAAWRESADGRAAVLASGEEVVITGEVEELEALAAGLIAADWSAFGALEALATPMLLARLKAGLEAREGLELWLRRQEGLRKVEDY